MLNSMLEKKWTRWYPKKILLKNKENNKKFLYDSYKFTKKDFFINVNNKKELDGAKIDKSEMLDVTMTKEYKIGFKKGFIQASEENILLKNRLNRFFLEFEKSFSIFQNTLCSRLLKTVLIVTSYLIGKTTDVNESLVISYIKKIIDQDGILLKKPRLIVNPHNRILIEKIFIDFFNTYKWELVYDDTIELNSFKIKSENSHIDATVDARWQELRRLIDSEE